MDIILKSGREIYANRGIFGIEEKAEGFSITEGYDTHVLWPPPKFAESHPGVLTADDMREIVDLTIDRWTRFRASL